MTKLGALRSRLDALHRRRSQMRLATAWSGFAVVVLWSLLAVFVVDRAFTMSRPQRLVTLLLAAGGIAWAWRRIARPLLAHRESAIDVALLVERRAAQGSDLVAALQFESPAAETWGSRGLREAVIDRAGEFGNTWNLPLDPPSKDLVRRAAALGVTGLLLCAGLLASPRQAVAFLNRAFMGSAHYPGSTTISRVLVNGTPVSGARVRAPYGEAIRFEIHAAGKLPDEGYAILRPVGERTESRLRLVRAPGDAAVFAGVLPAVVNPLRYQVYVGDAWTDPATIQLLPLPVIETRLTPTAPAYAAAGARESEARSGALELAVAEGSRVDVAVTCRNKRLKVATLIVAGTPYPLKASQPAGGKQEIWTLETERTPLARVTEPVLYDIQVTDADGMQLPEPIRGSLRIKADQLPAVTAATVSRYVLPAATVPIVYRVTDDYGIQKLQIHLEVVTTNGMAGARVSRAVRPIDDPIPGDQMPLTGTSRQPLDALKLVKGDQVRVTLEAVDYRGRDAEGRPGASDPIVLTITDEAGILAELAEPDVRAAAVIDEIINSQLGITAPARKESNP